MKIISKKVSFNKDISKSSAIVGLELEINKGIHYSIRIDFKKSKLLGDEFLRLKYFLIRERRITESKMILDLLRLIYNDFVTFASQTLANACEIAVRELLELGINIRLSNVFVHSVGFRSPSAWVNIRFDKSKKRFLIPKQNKAFVFINMMHVWEQYLQSRGLNPLITNIMQRHEALLKPVLEFWAETLIHEFTHILDPNITSKHGEFYLKSKHSNIWRALSAKESLAEEGFAELSTIILNPNLLTTKDFYDTYKLVVNTDFSDLLSSFRSNEEGLLELTAAAYLALLSILDSLINGIQKMPIDAILIKGEVQPLIQSLLNFLRFHDYPNSALKLKQALNDKKLQSIIFGLIKHHLKLKQEVIVLKACENSKKYGIKTKLAKSLMHRFSS